MDPSGEFARALAHGHGLAKVDTRFYAHGGKVSRVDEFNERAEALAAVGLSE